MNKFLAYFEAREERFFSVLYLTSGSKDRRRFLFVCLFFVYQMLLTVSLFQNMHLQTNSMLCKAGWLWTQIYSFACRLFCLQVFCKYLCIYFPYALQGHYELQGYYEWLEIILSGENEGKEHEWTILCSHSPRCHSVLWHQTRIFLKIIIQILVNPVLICILTVWNTSSYCPQVQEERREGEGRWIRSDALGNDAVTGNVIEYPAPSTRIYKAWGRMRVPIFSQNGYFMIFFLSVYLLKIFPRKSLKRGCF